MTNRLLKVWIGLVALSGVLIFIHSQELKNDLGEDFFTQTQLQKMKKLNASIEVVSQNENQFQCNPYEKGTGNCNLPYCKIIRENQINQEPNIRP